MKHRDKTLREKREYAQTEKGRAANLADVKRYRAKTPHMHSAREAVRHAIKRGKLARPQQCEAIDCQRPPKQAHHNQYDKPSRLRVAFLCVDHHEHVHHIGALPLKPSAMFAFATAPQPQGTAA